MRIAFLWQGITEHYGKRFQDGLYLALKRLEETETIGYFEPDDREGIDAFKPDVLLYWAALCESQKPLVASYPYKKAICFAGGSIEEGNVHGFDLYFSESAINDAEFAKFNKPYLRAFGVNELLYKPMDVEKKYDAAIWASFAKWKRHHIFAESVGNKGIAIGQHQAHEPECYKVCEIYDVEVHKEKNDREFLVTKINESHTALNTAEFWGGGQRMTLEALACNVPPIVMSDSVKNREYVEESGFGLVVDPNPNAIRDAIENLKSKRINSRDYIMSKWTSKHYAKALKAGLKQIL